MCLCCLLLNIYATFESTYKFYIEKNILVHHQILIVLPRAPNGPKKCGCRRDFSRLSETSRPRSKEFIVCSRLQTTKSMGASAPPAPTSLAPLSITIINLATAETLEFLAAKLTSSFTIVLIWVNWDHITIPKNMKIHFFQYRLVLFHTIYLSIIHQIKFMNF